MDWLADRWNIDYHKIIRTLKDHSNIYLTEYELNLIYDYWDITKSQTKNCRQFQGQ